MAKLRWQLKWQKFSHFWLIQQTFVTVNLPWNIFREVVLRPLACSAGGNCPHLPPLITPLIGEIASDSGRRGYYRQSGLVQLCFACYWFHFL